MEHNAQQAPILWWDPSWLHSTRPLPTQGEIVGSPFLSLAAAHTAVQQRRAAQDESSPDDNVFLITYTPRGWVAFEYSEVRMGRVDLGELTLRGLPLGGSLRDPHTYIVDAHGRAGKLTPGTTLGTYHLTTLNLATLPTPAPPTPYLPAVMPETVVNHGKNLTWQPQVALRPGRDVDALSHALQWIHTHLPQDITIKAGGWRHSYAPVAETDGVYIHPEHMQGVERLMPARVTGSVIDSAVDTSQLFQVLAGTRIRQINTALWAAGQALPYLGGYDGQTLGGVLPTGTHGSVLRYGPLAELVRSLDLVRFDGTKVRIEPQSQAITAPAAFQAQRPNWELVQHDDDFHAVLVSMGTMGVVHSFIVEAVERFWLKEVRTLTSMPQARAILSGGNIYHLLETTTKPRWIRPADQRAFAGHPKPAYHEELLWNPYTDTLIVTSRHPVDAATHRNLVQHEPTYFANPPVRNLFRALKLDAMADAYSRPDLTELLSEHLGNASAWVLERVAESVPQLLPTFIDSALQGLPDPSYIQRSYNVFNIGEGANTIPALSATLAIPLRDDMWLQAIDVIRDVATRLAHTRARYQTGPISLRFVRGSAILLAAPEDVCQFEIIFGGDNTYVRNLAHELVTAYYLALYDAFGGSVRFHWGQLIPAGTLELPGQTQAHRIPESYPSYEVWRSIRDRYDPWGHGLNAWQRRLLP